MEQIDPRQLLVRVAQILERLKISYMVTGGIAVFVWGRPRFTADIDIIIGLKSNDVDKLAAALMALGEYGYVEKNTIREALSRHGEFNFIDGESGIKVDFWIPEKSPFTLSQFQRRIGKDILGQTVYFISPEDLILSKLDWYKQTESSRHLEDVESILKISEVDVEYIKKWAEKQSMPEIFENLLNKIKRDHEFHSREET